MMSATRLVILSAALLLIALYLSAFVSGHDHGVKMSSLATKRVPSFGAGLDAPQPTFVPIERQIDGLIMPQLMIGSLVPIAVLVGIGLILAKLLAIGVWALKSGGGIGGLGGYPGSGGFGGGYPGGGYGGYGGYGQYGGGGGYGSTGWRADQGFGRSLNNAKGQTDISPFISSTVMSLVKHVSRAIEKYDKTFDDKSEKKSGLKP